MRRNRPPRGLGRRGFLAAGGAGLGLALPLLRAGRLLGQPETPPRRLCIWFTPNGVVEETWRPTGGETDFALSDSLAPLAPYRDRLLFFGPSRPPETRTTEAGVSIHVSHEGVSAGHELSKLLTGTLPRSFAGHYWPDGPSVDQIVAARIGTTTPFRSIELGNRILHQPADYTNRMIYAGAGRPLPPEDDPARAWDRLFAAMAADGDQAAALRRRRRRRSLLDATHDSIAELSGRLGPEDRRTLEAHAESVRDVERSLQALEEARCLAPHRTVVPEEGEDEWETYPLVGRLQLELLAMAFACDLTRVGSMQWSVAGSYARHPWADSEELHHELSHQPRSNADAMDQLTRVNRWYAEELAWFLGRLDAVPEGDGTLLDHTLVLCVNELSDGELHTHQNMPFFLAGGAGGALRTGRYLRFDRKPHNDLLVGVCHAMGLDDVEHVGDARFGTGGPLPGMLA